MRSLIAGHYTLQIEIAFFVHFPMKISCMIDLEELQNCSAFCSRHILQNIECIQDVFVRLGGDVSCHADLSVSSEVSVTYNRFPVSFVHRNTLPSRLLLDHGVLNKICRATLSRWLFFCWSLLNLVGQD